MTTLTDRLGIDLPIISAPMAGTATPELAAAVSNAGGLGSIGIGTSDVEKARELIRQLRALTERPFHVNLFCDPPAQRDAARDAAWLDFLSPSFQAYGAEPPTALTDTSQSFLSNAAALTMLLEERPPVVSFHFGLPDTATLTALRDAGIVLIASATNLDDARTIESAGLHAVIAQGIEAGGHRGVFDLGREDERLGTFTLTRLLVRELSISVIAAGGIMDGAGIAACLALGAGAAQLGTAFIACPESAASDAYRQTLLSPAAEHTAHTSAISGRPARGIVNQFMREAHSPDAPPIPDYPLAYDAFKSLARAANDAGEPLGAFWAGQGARLARAMPAADLVATLNHELEDAVARLNDWSSRSPS